MQIRQAIASLLLLFSAFAWSSPTFNVHQEFPNFFSTMEASRSQDLLEQALASIYHRLIIPIKDQVTGEIHVVPAFEKLNSIAKQINPKAEVFASGGTVRSPLAYIYNQLYEEYKVDPHFSVEASLKKIATGRDTIPFNRVLGLGSLQPRAATRECRVTAYTQPIESPTHPYCK